MQNELLTALDQSRSVFWYCDDKKSGKVPYEVKEPNLKWAKTNGMGVFFAVNELGDKPNDKGNLRHDANVTRPLACFADFDSGTHEEQMEKILNAPIEPSAFVKSGHGYHVYWFLTNTTVEDLTKWSNIQKVIAQYFGSDSAVHDRSRIMRLPGSWHCKDAEAKEVKLEKCDPTIRYTIEELETEFPTVVETKAVTDVEKLIAGITGNGGRNSAAVKVVGMLLNRFKPHEWEPLAWPMLKSWNLKSCNPPDEEHILRSTFESISEKETKKRQASDKGVTTFSEGDMVPEICEKDDSVIVRIPIEDGISQFTFQEIEQSKSHEIEVLLSVELIVPGSHPRPFTGRINIVSVSAREGYARQLGKSLGKNVLWEMLLSTACAAIIEYLASRDLSIDLSEVSDEEAPTLFPPFLVKDGANLIFGDGGTGKTFFCLRTAISMATGLPFMGHTPKEVTGTLFVDYEDNEKTASYRLSRLCADPELKLDPVILKKSIRYFNPQAAPLYSIVPALKKIIKQHNIGLILVDSVASACGSEPEKAESASRYYNALKSLGITSLSIAHVTKTVGEVQKYAFGSVFWHNLARNTWNIQGEEDADEDKTTLGVVMGEKSKQLGLFHRKCNNGAKSRPINIKIVYAEDHVRFEEGKPDYWNKDKKLEDRIIMVLKTLGKKTKAELANELLNVPDKTLKNMLTILKDNGRVLKDDVRGGCYYVRDYVSHTPPVVTGYGTDRDLPF